MTFEHHIANICRSAYYHLHSIYKIRCYLDQQSTKQLVHAMVISRLDTCNSLLYGLPATLVDRLQRVQNACARTIMKASRRDHVTPLLKELHWLPIKCRITFKILMLTYKCINGFAPDYLAKLLTVYDPPRQLRSCNQLFLNQPTTRTKTGERAFSWAAPRLWNALPPAVRQCNSLVQFKHTLKTLLFTEYYVE